MSAPTLMVGATLPGNDRDVWTGEEGSLQWASRQALGAHQRALGALIAVIGSREITAGVEPAHRNGKVATLTVGLSHDVSSLLGIGPPSLAAARTLRSRSSGRRMRDHTNCAWVLLYIERWLKAPVQMEDGSVGPRTAGTPQGGVISPLLANLFLHYAFDAWMSRNYPHIRFERYADDAICHCKSAAEARALAGDKGRKPRAAPAVN
jgi:hypothetical protein